MVSVTVTHTYGYALCACRSAEGDALCAAMKKHGFKFFGPTISYTFLQAAGLVNDHLVSCHCYQHIKDSYQNT